MTDSQSKLKSLLRELFQLDNADLDFGIYRIMNAKRVEIERFLDNDLLPQVKTAFEQYQSSDSVGIKAELEKTIQQAKDMGVADPETLPKVKELRGKFAGAVDVAALESQVFSNLYTFFRRYYSEGDFLSLRRYKEGVYAIPYEGEEVKLYWANHDQYYIKSSEYLRDYRFKVAGGKCVHFKLTQADTEKDNNKPQNGNDRRFMIAASEPVSENSGELIVRFEYRSDPDKRRQDALNADALNAILKSKSAERWIPFLTARAPTSSDPERTVLSKHLSDYTTRNTFDYFIHKNVRDFLRRELDFFIKNEVMHLDDVETSSVARVEQYLSTLKVLRSIAHKVIDFVTQIEEFQRLLWLKKKFVVDSHYCVTLDLVPEALYPDIIANKAQLEEWNDLYRINEIQPSLTAQIPFTNPLSIGFLKENRYLVVDTRHFDDGFTGRLLRSFQDIDERVDGILVNADNFQALNLLVERFRGQVRATYIDPPYNTPYSEIIYKNDYKHSTWLTLLSNTFRLVREFWQPTFSFGLAIDDYEVINLAACLDGAFPELERSIVVVNHHPQGSGGRLSRTHEYLILLSPKDAPPYQGKPKDDAQEDRSFMRSGTAENNFRHGRWRSFYALLVDPVSRKVVGVEEPPPLGADYPKGPTPEGKLRVYPVNSQGEERVWRSSYETGKLRAQNGELSTSPKGSVYQTIDHEGKRETLFSNWTGTEFNAGVYGTSILSDLGFGGQFDYPKSVHAVTTALWAQTFADSSAWVLDYFGGSGTTAHSVIDMNRQHSGRRRYVLVEMGEHCDKVIRPRIKKVVYSSEWKNGKPAKRDGGTSHCLKCLRLESYEDALANLTMHSTAGQQSLLASNDPLREDYTLRYMLGVESKGSPSLLNIDAFKDPFSYTLNVATGTVGETRPKKVDLVETFNWLLGLRVKTMDTIRGVRVVTGTSPQGDKVLVLWRNVKEMPSAMLDEFFQKQGYNTKDMEFDVIYVNGDNNLENLRKDEETWKVRLIEDEFSREMFDLAEHQQS